MLKLFAGRPAAGRGAGTSFAHLAGLRPGAKKAEDDDACSPNGEAEDEDEERKRRDGESDDEYAERMKKLDAKKKGEHDEPDGDEDDEGNEPDGDDNPDKDEDEEDAKKVKKAKAAGFGSSIAAARRMERRRCAAILGSPKAAENIALAASLACETDLAPRAALTILDKGASSVGRLSRRMQQAGSPHIGSDVGGDIASRDPVADSWARAAEGLATR